MNTFSEVIDAWESLSDFAEDAGVSYGAAKQMRRRDSIDSPYWTSIIAGAEKRGIAGVTPDLLAQIAASRKLAKEVANG